MNLNSYSKFQNVKSQTTNTNNYCQNLEIIDDVNQKINKYAKVLRERVQNDVIKYKLNKVKNIQPNDEVVAEGFYIKEFKSKGWNKLTLKTYSNNGKTDAYVQSYFAGYIEGRISSIDIKKYYKVKDKKNNLK